MIQRRRYVFSPTSHLVLPFVLFMSAGEAYSQPLEEDEDNLSLSAGVRHTWDSNYLREADGTDEQITVLSADAKAQKTLSRQTFRASAGVSQYLYSQRDYLDSTVYRWGLGWRGAAGNRIGYSLSWGQKQRLPDRDDFDGDDIITMDEKNVGLSLKMTSGWRLLAKGRLAEQTHSNEALESIDYEEQEAGGGIGYVTDKGSKVDFYLLTGERDYYNQNGALPGSTEERNLNFDYQRATLEASLRVGGNTSVEGFVSYFNRDGGTNDGSGLETGIEATIDLTGKTSTTISYSLLQPPVGEESSNPDLTHRVSGRFDWKPKERINVMTGGSAGVSDYSEATTRVERTEYFLVLTPVEVTYQFSEYLEVNGNTRWLKRRSPLEDRDYSALEATVGLKVLY